LFSNTFASIHSKGVYGLSILFHDLWFVIFAPAQPGRAHLKMAAA
jgi:hypothetical protein